MEHSTMALWVEYQNKYITILKENLANRKTPIYYIISQHSQDEIGLIKWYGAWRKYCFFPNGDTIWDNKCLESIVDFLQEINTPIEKRTTKNDIIDIERRWE